MGSRVDEHLSICAWSLIYTEVKQQMNEQLKCLDIRMESQLILAAEFIDFYRRRSELEEDYSNKLDKLVKSYTAKHKFEKAKREQWHLLSAYSCWQNLITSTKQESQDHAVLAEIYSNNMINRFTEVQDNVQRIYKTCRDIGAESHEEILKVIHELHTAMKTYHTYFNECKQAEAKLRFAEHQRSKLENSIAREKLEKSKKFRLIGKEIKKRKSKYNDAWLKEVKARNEYLLCIDTANSSIKKYFVDDLSDLIDCMDFGFHNCIARAFMTWISAKECFKKSKQTSIDVMNKCVSNLDSRVDKQKFLEYNNQSFMIPKKFTLHSQHGDEASEVKVCDGIKDDLDQRFQQLHTRLATLTAENEEIWKTLETDYDCKKLFEESDKNKVEEKIPATVIMKKKADQQEIEDFYLWKFREYTLNSNLIARLQAKYDVMRKALSTDTDSIHSDNKSFSSQLLDKSLLSKPAKKKRIGRTPIVGHPKLFGGSLEEYVEATNQEIPLIIRSCIRFINRFGLQHAGIFRVSGAQIEINVFKESFEKFEDPLAGLTDGSDANSVAGVLKLYFRELREPLFPLCYFEQLMEISKSESKQEIISKMRDVVSSLPRPVYVVLRYLFSFLNHLIEFQDENMMDAYNLAICFGPTLILIPEDKDQVCYFTLVNELVKSIIIYQEEIFDNDGGPVYEKISSANTPDEIKNLGTTRGRGKQFHLHFFTRDRQEEMGEKTERLEDFSRPVRTLYEDFTEALILSAGLNLEMTRTVLQKTNVIPPIKSLLPLMSLRDMFNVSKPSLSVANIPEEVIASATELFCLSKNNIDQSLISKPVLPEALISTELLDVGESPPDQSSVDADAELGQSEDDDVFSCLNYHRLWLFYINLSINDKLFEVLTSTPLTNNKHYSKCLKYSVLDFSESEKLEAIAQYDFLARSNRELSFRSGDTLTLYNLVSSDWWRGSINGKYGLIPDKYIHLKIRDEDSEKVSNDGSEVKRRKSSSSDSLGSGVSPRPGSASRSILSESGIGLPYCDIVDENDAMLTSSSSLSSDLLTKDTSDLPSPKQLPLTSLIQDSDRIANDLCANNNVLVIREESDNKELSIVLDSALAAVFNSISTLERQKVQDKRVQTKDTPDLVIDLPLNASSSSPPSSSPTTSNVVTSSLTLKSEPKKHETEDNSEGRLGSDEETTAEVFAQSNQCTLKKGSSMSRSTSHVSHLVTQSPVPSPSCPVKRSTSSSNELNTSTLSFSPSLQRESSDRYGLKICEPTITKVSCVNLKVQPAVPVKETQGCIESCQNEDVWLRRVIDEPVCESVIEKRSEKTVSDPPLAKARTVEINLGLRKVQNVGTEISSVSSIKSIPKEANVSSFKPKPKVPPPVMKKPNFKQSHSPSPELMKKFSEREYRQTSC
ncbi:SLIT-ROBO Rho GTPase-activating protein 1 [Nymphon striatum]|nr:SLIT-ROBO Rho GTPase-activating protein 1 [Nymphon striatum]